MKHKRILPLIAAIALIHQSASASVNYTAQKEDSYYKITGTLKFTGWLTLRYFGRSVLLAAELAGFLLISWLLPQIFPLLPAAVCLLMSLTIEPVFRLFQPETDNASVDAWYNE